MVEFTVYGRPGCGYCVAAARLLESKALEFEYVDIHAKGISPQQLATKVGKPVRTVPQIMHRDKHVGGYSELVPYLKDMEAA